MGSEAFERDCHTRTLESAHEVQTCVPLGWKSTPLTESACSRIVIGVGLRSHSICTGEIVSETEEQEGGGIRCDGDIVYVHAKQMKTPA